MCSRQPALCSRVFLERTVYQIGYYEAIEAG